MGPIVGALAAGLLYEFVFDERRVGAQTGAEKLQQVEQVEMTNEVRDHSDIDANNVERPVDVRGTNSDGPVDVSRKSNGFTDDTKIQL